MIAKDVLGSKMLLSENDPGISTKLKGFYVLEGMCPLALYKLLKLGDICIDVGANIGYYALLEALALRDSGYVYAIEPLPDNVHILEESISANGYKNIGVYPVALGNKNQPSSFNVDARLDCGTMAKRKVGKERANKVNTITVEEITLDAFVELEEIKRIDLLRIDAEKYEVEIIEGANKALELMPTGSFIMLELHLTDVELVEKFMKPLLTGLINKHFVPYQLIEEWQITFHPELQLILASMDREKKKKFEHPHLILERR